MTGWQAAVLAVYLGSKLDKQNRQAEAEERAREEAEREAFIREIDPEYAAYREAERQAKKVRWTKLEAGIKDEAPEPIFITQKDKIKAALLLIFMVASLAIAVACLVSKQGLLAFFFVLAALSPLLGALE